MMKQKIGIKHFNMEVLKKALELAQKELGRKIEVHNDYIVLKGRGYYDDITISKTGDISYDSMARWNAEKTTEIVRKYYTAVASVMALKNMGYDVELQKGQNGELQVVGVMP